jgi:RNA polymerase-binding protein DksA
LRDIRGKDIVNGNCHSQAEKNTTLSRTNGHEKSSTPKPTNGRAHAAPTNGRLPAGTPSELPAAQPLPPTHLSDEELAFFRQLLLEKRRELVGDVSTMENEALGKNRADAAGDLSLMPIHMADIGTDNYEQEFTIGLIANERETLKEIDAAIERIDNRTYGSCLATHKPISKARLKAKPWASHCLEYKRAQEENHRR